MDKNFKLEKDSMDLNENKYSLLNYNSEFNSFNDYDNYEYYAIDLVLKDYNCAKELLHKEPLNNLNNSTIDNPIYYEKSLNAKENQTNQSNKSTICFEAENKIIPEPTVDQNQNRPKSSEPSFILYDESKI